MKRIFILLGAVCLACAAWSADPLYGWKSLESLEKAAHEDKAEAQADLGRYYVMAGQEKEALPWLKKAAKKDKGYAYALLGLCYETGDCGEKKDLKKALSYYKKGASKGAAMGLYKWGVFLHEGTTGKRQSEKAVKLILKAAEKNSPDAWRFLARGYESGQTEGLEQDYKKARKYWEKLSENGETEATVRLARLYEDGLGGAQDLYRSFELHLQAAEEGHVGAQNWVVQAYLNGTGVEKNETLAQQWLEKSNK